MKKLRLSLPYCTNYNYICSNCPNLSAFKFNNVAKSGTSFKYAFAGCKSLPEDFVMDEYLHKDGFTYTDYGDINYANYIEGMFANTNIKSFKGTFNNVESFNTTLDSPFENCGNLTSIKISFPKMTGNIHDTLENIPRLETVEAYYPAVIDANTGNPFTKCPSIKSMHIELPNALTVSELFHNEGVNAGNWDNLETVTGDFSSATTAQRMFRGCKKVKKLNINLPKVTDARGAFYNSGLETLEGLNMPSLEVGTSMFSYGAIKGTLDLSSFPRLGKSNYMFDGCKNIRTVKNLKLYSGDHEAMFLNCTNLTTIEGNIDIEGTSCSFMFAGCKLDKESTLKVYEWANRIDATIHIGVASMSCLPDIDLVPYLNDINTRQWHPANNAKIIFKLP